MRVAGVHAGALDVLHDAGDQQSSPSQITSTSTSLPTTYLSTRIGWLGRDVHRVGAYTRAARPRCRRSPSPARRARRTGARAPGSRSPRATCTRLLDAGDAAARPASGCRARCSMRSNWFRSSARSIDSKSVPKIGTPVAVQRLGEVDRRLPAELHDHAVRLLVLDDVEHVLDRQRLEVEPVGGVEVGGDGLRVVVDDDRLVARLPQRPHRSARVQ